MERVNNPKVMRLSPENKHFFYGYYDNKQISDDGRYYLFNHVDFMNRMPVVGDICRLGYIEIQTGATHYFGETNSWNFQQGCMLEWDPKRKDCVYYNFYDGIDYRSCRHNVTTGEKTLLPRANADISPDGKFGLSINFSRLFDFRPGYGYCNYVDHFKNVVAPEEDGIFLTDLDNATSKLIVSYETLYELFNTSEETKNCKVAINHITFNAESDRFLFLIRCFPHDSKEWKTALGTCDLEGNVYLLRNYTFASHYHWKEDGTLLIYADCGEGNGLYELKDISQDYKLYSKSFFTSDIHCTYSPDRQWIVGDGYPNSDRSVPTLLYNRMKEEGLVALRTYSPTVECHDIRCDLHSKWTSDGKSIVFDSIHEGYRGIYSLDLTPEMETIKNR